MRNLNKGSAIRLSISLLVLLSIVLVAIGATVLLNGNNATETDPFESSAVTQTPKPTQTPQPTVQPTRTKKPRLPATATVIPDLRFGMFLRQHNCDFYTKIITRILEEEMNLTIEVIQYTGPPALYTDLADSKLDYSLCHGGAEDRGFLEKHYGFISILDNRFVDENGISMQVMVPTKKANALHREYACVENLLANMTFSRADSFLPVDKWFAKNNNLVTDWIKCK